MGSIPTSSSFLEGFSTFRAVFFLFNFSDLQGGVFLKKKKKKKKFPFFEESAFDFHLLADFVFQSTRHPCEAKVL